MGQNNVVGKKTYTCLSQIKSELCRTVSTIITFGIHNECDGLYTEQIATAVYLMLLQRQMVAIERKWHQIQNINIKYVISAVLGRSTNSFVYNGCADLIMLIWHTKSSAHYWYSDTADVTLTVPYIWHSKKGVKTTCPDFLTVTNAISAAAVYVPFDNRLCSQMFKAIKPVFASLKY